MPPPAHAGVDLEQELAKIGEIVRSGLAFLAEAPDGGAIGFALARRRSPRVGFLSDLYVRPDARRRGVAAPARGARRPRPVDVEPRCLGRRVGGADEPRGRRQQRAPDGFFVPDITGIPGGAAEGMYVTNYGVPNDRLPPRGRQLLRAFAAASGGDPGPDYAAAYGAQAAEILLDAIARSDGTRRSVLDEVSRTVVTKGILGNISWDARGDLLEAPITIFRVQDGDFVVDRVVVTKPPQSDQ